jgi:hypothetical protein
MVHHQKGRFKKPKNKNKTKHKGSKVLTLLR